MDSTLVVDWAREALRAALVLGAPALLAALAIGLIVGLVQTVTQLHEPVIGLIPRLVGVLLVLLLVLPWMLGTWVDYATDLIGSIPDRL